MGGSRLDYCIYMVCIWIVYGLFQDAESRLMWKCVPGEVVSISECDGYNQKRTSLETRHRISSSVLRCVDYSRCIV